VTRNSYHVGFWWESEKENGRYEDLNVGGRIIIKFILREIGCGGMDWIDLAHDMDQCRVSVNRIMNFPAP
jgi:hypothetical protein